MVSSKPRSFCYPMRHVGKGLRGGLPCVCGRTRFALPSGGRPIGRSPLHTWTRGCRRGRNASGQARE
eukprot:1067630-Alexandrium_andersonii.AAC.1